MKKTICLFFMVMLVSGCAAFNSNYYTNPNSPGYTQSAFSGLCENCNRIFSFSKQQYDTLGDIQCPFCGHTQNLKMAYNRYTYLKQQQDTQANQQMWSNISQKMQDIQIRRDEAEQRNIQQFQQNIADWNANWQKSHNQVGTRWNPMHVTVDDN